MRSRNKVQQIIELIMICHDKTYGQAREIYIAQFAEKIPTEEEYLEQFKTKKADKSESAIEFEKYLDEFDKRMGDES